MKVATWNVNSVRARLPNILNWLNDNPVDILLLQEIKCVDQDFKLLKSARYSHSKKYIERLSEKYGFKIIAFKKTNIRLELTNSLEGYLFLLSKSLSSS